MAGDGYKFTVTGVDEHGNRVDVGSWDPVPVEPAPLDTGRWKRDSFGDGWKIDDATGDCWFLYRPGDGWSIEPSHGATPHITADDLDAAARIIRWHEEQER